VCAIHPDFKPERYEQALPLDLRVLAGKDLTELELQTHANKARGPKLQPKPRALTPPPGPPCANEDSAQFEAPPEVISQISEMGFTPEQARAALAATGNNVQEALDMLLRGQESGIPGSVGKAVEGNELAPEAQEQPSDDKPASPVPTEPTEDGGGESDTPAPLAHNINDC
jgi:hypothetical protein